MTQKLLPPKETDLKLLQKAGDETVFRGGYGSSEFASQTYECEGTKVLGECYSKRVMGGSNKDQPPYTDQSGRKKVCLYCTVEIYLRYIKK